MPTLFTRIIRGEIPAKFVKKTDELVAIEDIDPKAPTHVLIITVREIPTLNDLEESDAALVGKMVLMARDIAREKGFAESGYRLVLNCNHDGGQSVDHVHLHLLGGRRMTWPPG